MNIQVRDLNEEERRLKKNLIESIILVILAIILFILGLVWINMELDRMVSASNFQAMSYYQPSGKDWQLMVGKADNTSITEAWDIQAGGGYGLLQPSNYSGQLLDPKRVLEVQ